MVQYGCIFDFDGTLFDSMDIWDTAGEDYVRSLGYIPGPGLRQAISNASLHQAAQYIRQAYDLPFSVEEVMDGINKTVEDYYFYTAMPKPHIREFLQKLRQRGIRLCIATATDRYQIEAALKRCDLQDFFDEIFTCTAVGHGKDEPHIFEAALSFLGTDRDKTYIFEDAHYAAVTAKQAGFPVVAVADSHERREGELRCLADYFLENWQEAIKALES